MQMSVYVLHFADILLCLHSIAKCMHIDDSIWPSGTHDSVTIVIIRSATSEFIIGIIIFRFKFHSVKSKT